MKCFGFIVGTLIDCDVSQIVQRQCDAPFIRKSLSNLQAFGKEVSCGRVIALLQIEYPQLIKHFGKQGVVTKISQPGQGKTEVLYLFRPQTADIKEIEKESGQFSQPFPLSLSLGKIHRGPEVVQL